MRFLRNHWVLQGHGTIYRWKRGFSTRFSKNFHFLTIFAIFRPIHANLVRANFDKWPSKYRQNCTNFEFFRKNPISEELVGPTGSWSYLQIDKRFLYTILTFFFHFLTIFYIFTRIYINLVHSYIYEKCLIFRLFFAKIQFWRRYKVL